MMSTKRATEERWGMRRRGPGTLNANPVSCPVLCGWYMVLLYLVDPSLTHSLTPWLCDSSSWTPLQSSTYREWCLASEPAANHSSRRSLHHWHCQYPPHVHRWIPFSLWPYFEWILGMYTRYSYSMANRSKWCVLGGFPMSFAQWIYTRRSDGMGVGRLEMCVQKGTKSSRKLNKKRYCQNFECRP